MTESGSFSKAPEPQSVEASLASFLEKVREAKSLRTGSIAFRLTGDEAGEYYIDNSPQGVRLLKSAPQSLPLIEVIGDARRIKTILEGKKNARTEFLAGGIRVRGDLRYLSDVALELGILESPL